MFDRLFRNSAPRDLSLAEQRAWMVNHQLKDWGIGDQRVLDAMAAVPREKFIPESQRDAAYYDGALPIGEGQTISQPYVVAHMTELLTLNGDEKVLEVGTGSGYQTAVLSLLASEVFTIERIAVLAEQAQTTLQELGASNIHFRVGDGSCGWPEYAPYDSILVACAAERVPPPLIDQLADGGRLIMPVGPAGFQDLLLVRRSGEEVVEKRLAPVAFVPLIGKFA
jgi:protein-L-isoaspartate(D-aspartate) O-methyltransferase